MTQKESKHVRNALRTLLTLDLYFRGPEDDSKRVETCP